MYNTMQLSAIKSYTVETHLIISKVLDGDSLIVKNKFKKEEKEVRLYGLDAPENKRNRKLMEDEKKTHLAGQFLLELGRKATTFVSSIAPPNTSITIITEQKYFYDYYKRQLAYIILPNGICLNEILIQEGYAKPMQEYYCTFLKKYQQLNLIAKLSQKGLYAFTPVF